MKERPTQAARVWIVANTAWNVLNFRSALIRGLCGAGYEVAVCCPADNYLDRLKCLGVRHVELRLDASGVNPFGELGTLFRMWRLLREHRPQVLLTYTPKVTIYASFLANWLQIPVVANISGLGRAFTAGGWLERVSRFLYRLSLRHVRTVFFQNPDDRDLFLRSGLVRPSVCEMVPGSGVDLEHFCPRPPLRYGAKDLQFLLVGRMLWDKGIGEYVAAARLVKRKFPDATFGLLGFAEVDNPAAIPRAQLDDWNEEGVVVYLGSTDDVRSIMDRAECVVLPSYREGTPRSLLEASSMAVPIITTDAVGCRQVVDDGVSGYLCRVKDAQDLAQKMMKLLALDSRARWSMGQAGRKKMEREFASSLVVTLYLGAVRAALAQPPYVR